METKKITHLLETRYEYENILSLVYSPVNNKLNIIYQIITGSKYLDEYTYDNEINELIYLSTTCIERVK